MTESHCLAYCLGQCSNKTRSRKLQFLLNSSCIFLLVVMNQKYQKVFGGEKAIKKRFLVSLSFRDLRWEVPWINKEPCQTEQSPRHSPTGRAVRCRVSRKPHWGCGLGTAGLCVGNLADNFLLCFRVIELTSMETGSQTRANGIAGSGHCHSADITRDWIAIQSHTSPCCSECAH